VTLTPSPPGFAGGEGRGEGGEGASGDEATPVGVPVPPHPNMPPPVEGRGERGQEEPLNPFYLLLLLAGLAFVITAMAYAIIPVLEQKAIDAGEAPPPSAFRDALRADGWRWLLYELAAVAGLSVASMWLDRLRSLQSEKPSGTIPDKAPPATR